MNSRGSWISILFIFFLIDLSAQSKADSLLKVLQTFIPQKDKYVQPKLERIQILSNKLKTLRPQDPATRFQIYNSLFHEYKVFVFDSAFQYALRLSHVAKSIPDESLENYAKVKMSFILVSAGMFKESFDSLRTVNTETLSDSTKHEYYWLTARAYFDLGLYNGDDYFNRKYVELGLRCLDSALQFCQPNTYHYLYYSNYKNSANVILYLALTEVKTLLKTLPISTHQRAINNHHLGGIYLSQGKTDLALEAFLVSAIADIQAAVKENAALNNVADILYRRGDTKTAYALIDEALKDAVYYGARQRKIAIGSILPMIAEKELQSVESKRKAWLIYSTAITTLVILTAVFIFAFLRQLRKRRAVEQQIIEANQNLQEINRQLREADRIKEEYIGYYFNINSTYIEKTEETLNAIDQKLSARKFDDIRFILNNFNLKRERENLFVNFDKVFLKLFPDFVKVFNAHFKPEDQITLKDSQVLSPELRIYALIRMGIHDSEKIARILGYSVNTIYTYKTKIRSKVLTSKEEFERKIMEIETV